MNRPAWWCAALAAVVAGCGGSAPRQSNSGGPSLHALTVTVSGGGAVSSTPAGIACGSTCSATFAAGAAVSLSAAAAAGSVFAGWDGACSGQGACTVTMSADAAVTARFTPVIPPPAGSFTVTVATTGSGRVTSAPSGLDCGTDCSATFAAGTQVALTAAPASGFTFSGWSGGCSGAQACTVSTTASVAARFDSAPPPPPGRHDLTVAVSGQGTVTSAPAGISCGAACSAPFDDGAQVQLTATPAAGWQLSGFSGACSGQSCTVTMSAGESVAATFTQMAPPPPPPPPPPPANECAGLLPAQLGAPTVVNLPQEPCGGGTSDDGTGNYVLEWTAGVDYSFPGYAFFTIQNGNAVEIGQRTYGSDEGRSLFFSQPSGFTKFSENGVSNSRAITSFSHDGAQTSATALTSGERNSNAYAAVDPSGGTVAVISYQTVPGYLNELERFDKTGAVQFYTGLDDAEHKAVSGVAVDIAGHALVFAQGDTFGQYARWYDGAGAAMTPWFLLLTPSSTAFLPDGRLVLYDSSGRAVQVFRDGQQTGDTPPDWLQARASNRLYVARGGKAYATWGSGGACGGALEVLALSGKSCGCLSVPELSPASSVGRDGSLIVPANGPAPMCHYSLYPQLLK